MAKDRLFSQAAVLSAFLLFSSACLADEATSTDYSITCTSVFSLYGSGTVTGFTAFMPVARTNEYQTVWKVESSGGSVIDEKRYGNQLLYTNRDHLPENPFEMSTTTHFRPMTVRIDVNAITEFQKYDPESQPCQLHLGDRGNIVDTANGELQRISDELWSGSKDYLIYARKCYDYVVTHLEYDEFKDWQSLSRILSSGKGGSSDFSTLLVSLLRYRGIPARHNVCATFSQEYHTFVDFYLEGHGWIPVDPCRQKLDPDGDYFGVFDGSYLVLAQDIYYDVTVYRPSPVNIVQGALYFASYSDNLTSLSSMNLIQNNGVSGIRSTAKDLSVPGRTYNLHGQQVSPTSYKGLVISNGRKYVRK